MILTVPRTLFGLAGLATIVRGDVLDGLCLLGVLAIWVVGWPDPFGDDRH